MGLHCFDAGMADILKSISAVCAAEDKWYRDRTVELKALQLGLMVFGESSER